jgi:hypothetical protein
MAATGSVSPYHARHRARLSLACRAEAAGAHSFTTSSRDLERHEARAALLSTLQTSATAATCTDTSTPITGLITRLATPGSFSLDELSPRLTCSKLYSLSKRCCAPPPASSAAGHIRNHTNIMSRWFCDLRKKRDCIAHEDTSGRTASGN